ncbi:hypothetical protein ALC60_14301, partial [Trachymyrmex zeteki]
KPRFFITLMNHSRRHLLSVIQSARQRRGPQSTLLASHRSHSHFPFDDSTARSSEQLGATEASPMLVLSPLSLSLVGCQTMTVDQLRSTPTSPDAPDVPLPF